MAYTTNRLNEALKKLADVDEAVGDLMSRDPSPTANFKVARNHLNAAYVLLDALLARSYHTNQRDRPMTTKDLNRIAETAEAARRVGEKVKEIWTRRNALVAIRDAKDPHTEAHRRFCNSESEFRSVIEMCKEPHKKTPGD